MAVLIQVGSTVDDRPIYECDECGAKFVLELLCGRVVEDPEYCPYCGTEIEVVDG